METQCSAKFDDEQSQKYYCIWNDKVVCRIRNQWKLRPESLILFCENCTELPLNQIKSK